MAREFARRFYRSKEWKRCRDIVMKRDYYLCVKCGSAGQEVHHIKYLTPHNIDDPKITLNMDNLITLCRDCHHEEHKRNQYTVSNVSDGLKFDINGNLVEDSPPY